MAGDDGHGWGDELGRAGWYGQVPGGATSVGAEPATGHGNAGGVALRCIIERIVTILESKNPVS